MKLRFSNLCWGVFLLLAAAFVLVSQFDCFGNLGVGSIIATILALMCIVHSVAHLRFTILPIPLAVLYIVFHAPLNLPYIQAWSLILASVLASIGLSIIFPKRHWFRYRKCKQQMGTESYGDGNNPSVSVNFGAISRHLHANNLETAEFNCNFGALEIFFDQVELSHRGAEVTLNCNFGAIELFIPKHWRIIDKLNCSMGDIDIDKRFSTAAAIDAPQLTLVGSVSFGGIDVRCV